MSGFAPDTKPDALPELLEHDDLQSELWDTHVAKGWNKLNRTPTEETMLVVTELAEAVECLRNGSCDKSWIEPSGKPEGFAYELADAMIRLYNICSKHGWDAEELMRRKDAYNKTRPHLHGGRRL